MSWSSLCVPERRRPWCALVVISAMTVWQLRHDDPIMVGATADILEDLRASAPRLFGETVSLSGLISQPKARMVSLMKLVKILPDTVLPRITIIPRGVDVQGLDQYRTTYRVLYDYPIPRILVLQSFRRRQNQKVVEQYTPTVEDVQSAIPDVIDITSERLVTFRFMQWLAQHTTQHYVRERVANDYLLQVFNTLVARVDAGDMTVDLQLEDVAALAASAKTLAAVEECWTEALLLPAANEHFEKTTLLDGAGARIDAEYKMCRRVEIDGRFPFKCTYRARGVRGLYLGKPMLSKSAEGSKGYIDFLVALWRRRRRVCEHLPRKGLPSFVVLDSAIKYGRAVLVSLALVWPEYMLIDQKWSVLPWSQLIKLRVFTNAVILASDPPHRLWTVQQNASSVHPDFFFLIRDVQYVLSCLSMEPLLLDDALLPEQVSTVPLQFAARSWLKKIVAVPSKRMATEILAAAEAGDVVNLKRFVSSPTVMDSQEWNRVFGALPTHGLVRRLCFYLDVLVPFACGNCQWRSKSKFRDALQRCVVWYANQRTEYRRSKRTREEQRIGKHFPNAGSIMSQKLRKQFTNILRKRSIHFLWRWGCVMKDWIMAGNTADTLPIATTNVEGGFYASREHAFVRRQNRMSAEFFMRALVAASVHADFGKAWSGQLPRVANSSGARLDVLFTAVHLMSDRQAAGRVRMVTALREFVRGQKAARAEHTQEEPVRRSRRPKKRRRLQSMPVAAPGE